jgi:hypothetical protein
MRDPEFERVTALAAAYLAATMAFKETVAKAREHGIDPQARPEPAEVARGMAAGRASRSMSDFELESPQSLAAQALVAQASVIRFKETAATHTRGIEPQVRPELGVAPVGAEDIASSVPGASINECLKLAEHPLWPEIVERAKRLKGRQVSFTVDGVTVNLGYLCAEPSRTGSAGETARRSPIRRVPTKVDRVVEALGKLGTKKIKAGMQPHEVERALRPIFQDISKTTITRGYIKFMKAK